MSGTLPLEAYIQAGLSGVIEGLDEPTGTLPSQNASPEIVTAQQPSLPSRRTGRSSATKTVKITQGRAAAGFKVCRRCGEERELRFFPKDSSRPDGKWHSCNQCRGRIWREREKPRLAERRHAERLEGSKHSGLDGLKKRPRGRGIAGLPPELGWNAQHILNRSVDRAQREERRLSQQQIAARIANAVSNAPRLGDRSWSRGMLRLKGYRRAERRKAEQEAALAEQREVRKATKTPQINWQLRPW